MKKFIFGVMSGLAVLAGGMVFSKLAEKNPKLKTVRDKIVKTGKDFSEDVKEVANSIVDSFKKSTEDCIQAEAANV